MSTPPEWFQIAGPLALSTEITIGMYWQPQWMHRLFARLVGLVERIWP